MYDHALYARACDCRGSFYFFTPGQMVSDAVQTRRYPSCEEITRRNEPVGEIAHPEISRHGVHRCSGGYRPVRARSGRVLVVHRFKSACSHERVISFTFVVTHDHAHKRTVNPAHAKSQSPLGGEQSRLIKKGLCRACGSSLADDAGVRVIVLRTRRPSQLLQLSL